MHINYRSVTSATRMSAAAATPAESALNRELETVKLLTDYLLEGSLPNRPHQGALPQSRLVRIGPKKIAIHYRDGPALLELSPEGDPFGEGQSKNSALYEDVRSLVSQDRSDEIPQSTWDKLFSVAQSHLIRAEAFLVSLHMPCRALKDVNFATGCLELMARGMLGSSKTPEYVLRCENAHYKKLWALTERLIAARSFDTAKEAAIAGERSLQQWCNDNYSMPPLNSELARFRSIREQLQLGCHPVQTAPRYFPAPTSPDWVEPLVPTHFGLDIRECLTSFGVTPETNRSTVDMFITSRLGLMIPTEGGFILLPGEGDVLKHSIEAEKLNFHHLRGNRHGVTREEGVLLLGESRYYAFRSLLWLQAKQIDQADTDFVEAIDRFNFLHRNEVEENESYWAYQEHAQFLNNFYSKKAEIYLGGQDPDIVPSLLKIVVIYRSAVQMAERLRAICPYPVISDQVERVADNLDSKLYQFIKMFPDTRETLELKIIEAVNRDEFEDAAEFKGRKAKSA